jgi:glucose/arabinose dehydrogenase
MTNNFFFRTNMSKSRNRNSSRSRTTRFEALESRLPLTTLPAGFQESLVANLNAVTGDFASDGHYFVANKFGSVRVIEPDGVLVSQPFISIPVDTYADRGLIAVAVDPNFEQNKFVYILYTAAVPSNPNVPNNGAITRLIRVTASPTNHAAVLPNSTVVLVDGILSETGLHQGGFLDFGADGMLYVGVGDGEVGTKAQDLNSIQGKVLRLDVANYPNIIPSDNPFVGQAGKRGEIWAYGFRNPFSGAIKPGTNTVVVNDVGSNQFEEINIVQRGGNYGWPLAEGSSTNPNYINPIYSYAHNGGGAAVVGGSFYTNTTAVFPGSYQDQYFFADIVQGFIKTLDINTGVVQDFATGAEFITDTDIAPDGTLYWVTVKSFNSAVYRISYENTANRAPTAIATANITDGISPLIVAFSGVTSTDPDNDPLFYEWDFGDGTTGTGSTISKTYTVNGTYNATLTVRDRSTGGLSNTATAIQISVGNNQPTATILTPVVNSTYRAGSTISFSATGTDLEDGVLPDSAFTWSFEFGHNTHFHSGGAPLVGSKSGSFIIPITGEIDPDQYYRIILTVTDSQGLSNQYLRDVFPELSDFTLTTNIPGLSISLDSQPKTTPDTTIGVVGMLRTLSAPLNQVLNNTVYAFTGWSDNGASTHTIATPEVSTTYTANYANGLSASYVSSPPTSWRRYQFQTYNMTVTNTGLVTWNATGLDQVRLGVYFEALNDLPYTWTSEPIRFALPYDVAPGQSATITVSVGAPGPIADYVLRQRMVKEYVGWFDQLQKTDVKVGLLLATYAFDFPALWDTGVTRTIPVTLQNIGNETWNVTGPNIVNLGVYFDAPNDLPYTWATEPVRIRLPRNIAPGESVTVDAVVTSPLTAGPNKLRFRLVKEGIGWSDQVVGLDVSLGTLKSSFAASTLATNWNAGETKTTNVTVTNTGTITWRAAGSTPVNLGYYWDAPDDSAFSWSSEPLRVALPNDVAPGQSVTIPISVIAPTSIGQHVLRFRLIQLSVGWFEEVQKFNIMVGGLAASYTTTASNNWGIGATKTFTTTVTNTGTEIWLASKGQLAVYFDAPNDLPYSWTTPPTYVNLLSDLAPGQSQILTVTATSPVTVGSYILRQRMVYEGGTFFNQLHKSNVTVALDALVANYSVTPTTTWYTKQSQQISIRLTNTGTATWSNTGPNRVRLGAYFGASSDASNSWPTEPSRFELPSNVAPGESVTMTISVRAPATAGESVLRFRMVQEGVRWFDYMQKNNTVIYALSANYSGTIPTTWFPNETKTYQITLTNTTGLTWNATGANPVRLGVYFNGSSDAVYAWPSEPKRISLPYDVAPGASVTLNVLLTAPSISGTYTLRHRIVKEGIGWSEDLYKAIASISSIAPISSAQRRIRV